MSSHEGLHYPDDYPDAKDTTIKDLVRQERTDRKRAFDRLWAITERLFFQDADGQSQAYFKTWDSSGDELCVWLGMIQTPGALCVRAITNMRRSMSGFGGGDRIAEVGDFVYPLNQRIISAQYSNFVVGSGTFAPGTGPVIHDRGDYIEVRNSKDYRVEPPTIQADSFLAILDRRVHANGLATVLEGVPPSTHEPHKLLPPEELDINFDE